MSAIDLTNAYYLRLCAHGVPTVNHRVFSSDEAVAVWNDYRDSNGFGASDLKSGCGDVTDAQGKLIARISYNGRVWNPAGQPLDGMSGAEWLASRC